MAKAAFMLVLKGCEWRFINTPKAQLLQRKQWKNNVWASYLGQLLVF
jgi:hypothetical protein